MYEVLLVVYLLVAIALIGLVLIQHGKGASMGASFGAGASNTVFGASGSGNFLTKSTAILAIVFFVISLVLGAITSNRSKPADTWSDLTKPAVAEQEKTTDKPADKASDVKKDADVPN
ncbi:preprotein translocase subunit SecG [Tolumonas osonensis]|uniref:Protein-export membrane protein SecG n=1 Tax=Tolumonas osonensis TaxID=675874 RepID=A0A841GBZ7_9GAMM|nr:preprotein translocase subunit SecG [Tolumonas osonensis]MBB6055469.1 preprotein translocase subunit SecG [Tolumonas osonensis]